MEPGKSLPKGSQPKRRRRRGGKKNPAETKTASAVLKQPKTALQEKPVDAPLSPSEVSAMKQHFEFLKRHRKVLRLSLNAQEDLLLNGVKAPSHRGICRHLLGKLDKGRVLSAAERLGPVERTRMLEGIVRFSADVTYLLLYLESVKESAAQQEATGALNTALAQLDFDAISPAQMCKVLDLIVELFTDEQRPQILFGLLRSASFRKIFDSSSEGLPDELAGVLLPLRAAEAVVLHDRPNPCSVQDLRVGIQHMIQAPRAPLCAYPASVRARLFSLAVEATRGGAASSGQGLTALLESFSRDPREHSAAGMKMGVWLLAASREKDAKRLLSALSKAHPKASDAARWLSALDKERLGRLFFLGRSPSKLPPMRFVEAFDPICGAPVFVASGSEEHSGIIESLAAIYERSAGTGVPTVIRSETGKRPHLVLRREAGVGTRGDQEGRKFTEDGFRNACRDIATAMDRLGRVAISLAGLEPWRLGKDAGGRRWILDLSGASMAGSVELDTIGAASSQNTKVLKAWLLKLAHSSTAYLPSPEWLTAVDGASDCPALVRAVYRH